MLNFWISPKHKTFQLWINSDKEKIIAWQSTREAYGDYSLVPILKNEVLLSVYYSYLQSWFPLVLLPFPAEAGRLRPGIEDIERFKCSLQIVKLRKISQT